MLPLLHRFVSPSACVLVATTLGLTSAAVADTIPYPNKGTIAPIVTLDASTTGDVIGTFVSYSASDTDFVELYDATTKTYGPEVFFNKSTAPGTQEDLGSVDAGDTFLFLISNMQTGKTYSSDPNIIAGADGKNHAYITPFAGGMIGNTTFAAGTYVGLEDVFIPPSDLDYNDDTFLFNIHSTATPEPGSLTLLSTGALGLGTLLRRLRRSSANA